MASRALKRRSRYHKRPCPSCGFMVTNNALGRAAHLRSCPGRAERIRQIEQRERDLRERRYLTFRANNKGG